MAFLYDPSQSLGFLAGLVSRLLNNRLSTRLKEVGIKMTAEQWGALIVLAKDGPMSQRKLGQQLFLEKSSVSRLIDGLEKQGWILRGKDPEDSRKKVVSITSAVQELMQKGAPIARTVLDEAQRGMDEDELLVLERLLSHSIANLRNLEP